MWVDTFERNDALVDANVGAHTKHFLKSRTKSINSRTQLEERISFGVQVFVSEVKTVLDSTITFVCHDMLEVGMLHVGGGTGCALPPKLL